MLVRTKWKLSGGRRRLVPLAAVAMLLLTAGPNRAQTAAGELREEFHQIYTLQPGGRISLDNISGAVRLAAWDRNEVRVDAVKRAYTAEKLREAEIRVDVTPDAVRIKTKYPFNSTSWTDDEDGRRHNPAEVDYTVTVPRRARLDSITTINGPVDIEGVAGDCIASSINGRLTARGLTGEVKLSVINGRLDATFDRLDETRSISLSSVNGPIALIIPSDAQAELRANTVHGGISNEFQLPVRHGNYVGRDLAGRLGRGGARIKLENVNGPITIRHAADGRDLSPATNLLSETNSAEELDAEREAREARRAAREAQREAEQAQREAQRAQLAAQREAQRAQQEAQREAQAAPREAQQEAQRAQLEGQDAARKAQRAAEEAVRAGQREAQRAQLEAQRAQVEAQREAQRAQLEAQRAHREAQREAQQAQREAQRAAQEAARAIAEAQRELTRNEIVNDHNRGRQIERESKNFATSGTPRVRIRNFDGPITVHAWDKPEVRYTAVKRAMDEKEMKGIRVRAQSRSDETTERHDTRASSSSNSTSEVSILTEFDKAFASNVISRNGRIVSFSSGASVDLEIYVPRNAVLTVASGDGQLRVDGVRGELDLHTGDGSVDVSEGSGHLRVETGDGRIRIMDFDGDAEAMTGDGRITLEGRFTQLGARTGDGTISLAIPSDSNVTIETDAESVVSDGWAVAEDGGNPGRRVRRWRVGQGGVVFKLRTGDGQIVLRQR